MSTNLRGRRWAIGVVLAAGVILVGTLAVYALAPFTDVAGNTYEGYIYAAATAGIIKPSADGLFHPDDPILQQDFAVMMANSGHPVTVPASSSTLTREAACNMIASALWPDELAALQPQGIQSILAGWSDGAAVSTINQAAVALALEKNILPGTSAQLKVINPQGIVTRGEATYILLKALGIGPEEGAHFQVGAYVGSQACLGCHLDNYEGWKDTAHANMILDARQPGVVQADFSTLPDQSLLNYYRNAHYTVANTTQQRFLYELANGTHVYLPYSWDTVNKKWIQTGDPQKWQTATPWEVTCAQCHTTGYDATTKHYAEVSITCETCHGPGKDHILGHGDTSKITLDYSANTCAKCHAGRNQYDTWKTSAHAEALPALKSSGHAQSSCLACHSTEYILAPDGAKPTLASVTTSLTCDACHTVHAAGYGPEGAQLRLPPDQLCASCHNGSLKGVAFTPGTTVHHDTAEMFAGVGAPGVHPDASFHAKAGVTCVDCHAVVTGTGHAAGTNHTFQIVMPKDAGTPDVPNDSCTSCHKDSTRAARQAYIDAWQTTTKAELDKANALLAQAQAIMKSNPGLPATLTQKVLTAVTDISFVQADGSMGAHNFDYAMKTLQVAEDNLRQFLASVK